MTYEQVTSSQMTKSLLKSHAKDAAFKQLKEIQCSNKKVKHIVYTSLKTQPYLESDLFPQSEVETLTALRSHCVRGIKHNFPKMFDRSLNCPIDCEHINQEDNQDHVLNCKILTKETQTNISYIYSDDIEQQAEVARNFTKLMRKRVKLLEDQDSSASLPGA